MWIWADTVHPVAAGLESSRLPWAVSCESPQQDRVWRVKEVTKLHLGPLLCNGVALSCLTQQLGILRLRGPWGVGWRTHLPSYQPLVS